MLHFNTNQLSNEFNQTPAASSTRHLKDHLNEHRQTRDILSITSNLSPQTTLNKIVSSTVFEEHSFVVLFCFFFQLFSSCSQKQLILINGLNLLEETFQNDVIFFVQSTCFCYDFLFLSDCTFLFIYSRLLLLAYRLLRRWSFSKRFSVIKTMPICSCVFQSFLPKRKHYCSLS